MAGWRWSPVVTVRPAAGHGAPSQPATDGGMASAPVRDGAVPRAYLLWAAAALLLEVMADDASDDRIASCSRP